MKLWSFIIDIRVYGILFRFQGFSCWLHWDGNCSGRFRELLAVYVVFKFSACGVIKTCLLWYLSADASWKNVRSLCVVSQLNHKASVKPLWSPRNEPHCLGISVSAFVFKCHPSSVASTCIYQSIIDSLRWNLQSFQMSFLSLGVNLQKRLKKCFKEITN